MVLELSAPVVVIESAKAIGAAEINKAGKKPATVNSLVNLLSIAPPVAAVGRN